MSTTLFTRGAKLKTLAEVGKGSTVRLAEQKESAEADLALQRRLRELGLRPGASVTVGQRTAGGGRVVICGTARYAIDAATLRAIEVAA